MQHEQEAEPPSYLKPPLFMIGQNRHGNWVVQNQNGTRGGLFVDRAQALRFVRFENGNRPHGYIVVGGVFELDVNRGLGALNSPQPLAQAQHQRRVA